MRSMNWLTGLLGTRTKSQRRTTTKPPLALERLEDRTVPATVTWIGGSGDWDSAGNWLDATTSTNHVPEATDDVVIDTAGITVNHDSDSIVNELKLSGATVNGTGDLTVTGLFTWASGTLGGDGTLSALGGLTFVPNPAVPTRLADARQLLTFGTVTADTYGTTLTCDPGTVVENHGEWQVTGDTSIHISAVPGPWPLFRNLGSVVVDAEPPCGMADDAVGLRVWVTVESPNDWRVDNGHLELGPRATPDAVSTLGGAVEGADGTFIKFCESWQLGTTSSVSGDRVIFDSHGEQATVQGSYLAQSTKIDVTAVSFTGAAVSLGRLDVLNAGVAFASPTPTVATATEVNLVNTRLTSNGHLLLRDGGAYSQDFASTLTVSLGGLAAGTQYDQIEVDGAISLAGRLNVSAVGNFRPREGDRFTIVDNTGADGIHGVFIGLDEDEIITLTDGTQLQISYRGGDGNDLELTVTFAPVQPARLQGLVWEDFNDDGAVDFGERAIAGVAITLTGIDDRGDEVNQTVNTDAQGVYQFADLWPGTYTICETQPAGFADGRDILGTVDGQPAGDASVNDCLSGIVLPSDGDGINYNFAERPTAGGAVHHGQTATIGFWHNSNGQALIRSLNGGPTATQLGLWLAATFPNMYGAAAGVNNLSGLTNAQVAAFYTARFQLKGQAKLDAQVLAVALATYVTNESLAGMAAVAYGFQVTATGVGYSTFNVGGNGAAFGVANNTTLTVLDLLLATDAQARNGLLYDQDESGSLGALEQALRSMANTVYTGINEQGDI